MVGAVFGKLMTGDEFALAATRCRPGPDGDGDRAAGCGLAEYDEEDVLMALDIGTFARGFVAALVIDGVKSIQPKHPDDQRQLHRMWGFIGAMASELAEQDVNEDWFMQVVSLKNDLAPGTMGAFETLETALRDLQLSFTACGNPTYEDISFTISKPFAESELERMSEEEQHVVLEAVKAFRNRAD